MVTISFLISYKILHEGFNTSINTNSAIVARKAINVIGDILSSHDCDIWATSQALHKLDKLNSDQKKRLTAFINEEKTTLGVSSFDPTTSTSESAKALSREGPTIVIEEEENKESIHKAKRIFTMSPAEFLSTMEHVRETHDKLPFKRDLLDTFLFCVFKKEINE